VTRDPARSGSKPRLSVSVEYLLRSPCATGSHLTQSLGDQLNAFWTFRLVHSDQLAIVRERVFLRHLPRAREHVPRMSSHRGGHALLQEFHHFRVNFRVIILRQHPEPARLEVLVGREVGKRAVRGTTDSPRATGFAVDQSASIVC